MIYDEKYDIPIFEDEDILDAVDYSEKLKNALVTRFDKDNNTINTINDNIDGISNMVISIYRTKADANSVYTKKESDNKYANAIKQELVKVKEAQINSTGANLQNVQLFGKSMQESREGYNILKHYYNKGFTYTINGMTFTINDDYSVTINGTATGDAFFNLNNVEGYYTQITEGETYTAYTGVANEGLSFALKTLDNTLLIYSTNVIQKSYVSTYSGDTCMYLKVTSGYTLNNLTVYPMLVKGTEITEYEPYGAMPSIDYPSPINSITNVDYKIIGKNMAPANVETKTISGVSVKNNNDGTYTLNGTTTGERSFGFYAKSEEQKVNLKEGKTYKLVVKEFSGSKTAGSVTSAVRKDTGELVYNYINQSSPVVAAKYNSTLEFIDLYVSSAGVIFNNYRIGVMLIENGQDEEFEPYKEIKTTIALPENVELCSLPNGVVDCVDSTGVIHKKIGKIALGTQNWSIYQSEANADRYYCFTSDVDSLIKEYPTQNTYNFCNIAQSVEMLLTSTAVDKDSFCIGYQGTARLRFMLKKDVIDAQEGDTLSAKLNNLFISKNAYILAENIEETTQNLAETEKAKLQNLQTFEGINNITSNAPLSATYNTDTKSYIDSKFNTLAQQLLNIVGGN